MRDICNFFKNKTVFAILAFLSFALIAASCAKNDGSIPEYMSKPFLVDIEGEIDGTLVSARVFCDPTEHLTKEIYEKMIISFSSPESLSGVTVTLISSGKCITRLGDAVSKEYSSESISDFFDILSPQNTATRIKKEPDGKTIAEYEDKGGIATYIFDENRLLIAFKGEKNGRFFSFNVKTVEN